MADDARRLDKTIPGGRYLATDGHTYVDAWGKPLAGNESTSDEPKSETRDELNARAEALGIKGADKLPNKDAVLAAIEAKQAEGQ